MLQERRLAQPIYVEDWGAGYGFPYLVDDESGGTAEGVLIEDGDRLLKRVWEVIREAVSSKEPYIPGSIDYFLDELQKLYWKVDTFAAFSHGEHDLIRSALDYCQLDNHNATRMVNDSKVVARECFLRSLAALEPVFRAVFGDEELGSQIGSTHDNLQGQVNCCHDREPPPG